MGESAFRVKELATKSIPEITICVNVNRVLERVTKSDYKTMWKWARDCVRSVDKEASAMTTSACDQLAALYKKKAAEEGLIDVKFFVRAMDAASKEVICEEALRLEEAVVRGETVEVGSGGIVTPEPTKTGIATESCTAKDLYQIFS